MVLFQISIQLPVGWDVRWAVLQCVQLWECVCQIKSFLPTTNHSLALCMCAAGAQLGRTGSTLSVFVEPWVWACQAAQGHHHMITHFMNVQVKGVNCYALQNTYTKVKKWVLLEGHMNGKDRFVHLKAIMVMFSCRFNFQILHWQRNLISCLIRFICNEKEREVLMITGMGTPGAFWSGIFEIHLFL